MRASKHKETLEAHLKEILSVKILPTFPPVKVVRVNWAAVVKDLEKEPGVYLLTPEHRNQLKVWASLHYKTRTLSMRQVAPGVVRVTMLDRPPKPKKPKKPK